MRRVRRGTGARRRTNVPRHVVVGLLVLAVVATAGVTLAASPPAVVRYVMAGGGDQVSAGNFTVRSTIGQATTGRTTAVDDRELCSGYWCVPIRYDLFLPLVIRG
jgi:hypothetical protein